METKPVAWPPKLSIELVPSTCWYSNVRSEVTQKEWQKCRDLVRARGGDKCEVCGGRGPRHAVECHEVWDYNDVTLVQRLDGLIALCPDCHAVKHIGRTANMGRLPQAIEHLADVNGWDIEATGAYVTVAFERWEERSMYQWELDISYLETIGVSTRKAMAR